MEFSREQLNDIRAAVKFYQQYHTSIHSPRYKDYEAILVTLESYKDKSIAPWTGAFFGYAIVIYTWNFV